MNDHEQQAVPPPAPSAISQDDRLWAAGAHVGALVAAFLTSWMAGVAGALAALVVWLFVRDRYPFAAENAKEAFNFNVSMFIYMCIAGLIGLLLVGGTVLTLGIGALVAIPAGIVLLMALFALAIAWLVFTVIAAIKAYDGEMYRYPLAIRLLK